MKFDYIVKEIDKQTALSMVQRYHYSNTLPKINKHFLGFFLNEKLVGIVTLGYGTRPRHTIQKLFPSLNTNDYYEIGRMCMSDEMPRNSESQMLSLLVKWIKKHEPERKVLFTWADGMLGKAGYVYQASGFLYCGYSETDIYLKDGVKIHPRQTKKMFGTGVDDKRITARPTTEQMKVFGINHYKGKQFKYIKFLCGRTEKKKLLKELVGGVREYPKENDLAWRQKDLDSGKWIIATKPPYKTDMQIEGETK